MSKTAKTNKARLIMPDAREKNFGFGNQTVYAGKEAIRAAIGDGRYDRSRQRINAWERFCDWQNEAYGKKDLRDISIEIVVAYAYDLRDRMLDGEIGNAMVQNEICHVNKIFEMVRGDNALWNKPGDFCKRRSQVRKFPPGGIDREKLNACVSDIRECGLVREAAIVRMQRELGLRNQEAVSLDCRAALIEAGDTGAITVCRGTKGGLARQVPASPEAIDALMEASGLQPASSSNLIPAGLTREQFEKHYISKVTPILLRYHIKRPHDLRTAFACEKYQHITGYPAPVIAGRMAAPKSLDRSARLAIAKMLGHGRIDIASSYLGSAR